MSLIIRRIACLMALTPTLLMAQPTSLPFVSSAAPQSAILAEYIREGLANNLGLRQESLDINRVTESLNQARSLFYPRVAFNPTYSVAAGGRRLQFPVGDLLNPAYAALNGLTGSDRFPTNIPNVNQLLAPNDFHDTKLSVQYAFYNTDIRYNYLIQKSLLSAQEARKQVIKNEIRYTIQTASGHPVSVIYGLLPVSANAGRPANFR